MNRLKLLAAAMLLALPIISACGETPPPPPPTGSIDGLVSIEGQGIDGVSVTLSNGATVTTANGGMFRFDGVEAGAYTVTISNYPDDASFDQTSAAATIATDGENVTVNFPGTWIRTAAIMGAVTVENEGLGGVTVKLSGMSDSETLTDGSGQYAFSGLRAGNYTVQISGFDEEDVAFGSTSSTAMVAVGESKVVTFEGTYLRSSAITGQVTVENNPLEGVTVSLQGRGEDRTATTNGAGQFTFGELRRGDYSIGITNPDADEYSFEVTSKTITVAHGETANVPFEGILLRTASIIGTVTVEGTGLGDVKVTITGGPDGEEFDAVTNAAGQFSFTRLRAGEYSVGISGFDDDLYGFEVTTSTVTVELKETATVPFEGIDLRTAGIQGTITVEGHPLPGVTVTVTGGPKDEEHTRVTDDAGHYMVDQLHAGDYAVAISDFDTNEYGFEATTRTVSVGLRETATVAFQGDLLRTGGISGRVVVVDPDVGLDGITVTLSGDADMTAMTADGGQYAFSGLAEGDYTVAIEGWDEVAYNFDMTEVDRHVAKDGSEIVNFEGTHTRTASVSGYLFLDEVDADGMLTEGEPPLAMTAEMMTALAEAGIPGVPLLLQGPGVNDVQSGFVMPDGSYAFEKLMAGSYRVLVHMDAEGLAEAIAQFGFRFAGELTGQVVNVDPGMAATVNFPFRIVMQTIFAGAVMGNAEVATRLPVPGVTLSMYPTAEDADDGTNMLGEALTDSTGVARFDFARDMDIGPGGQGTDHLVFIKATGITLPGLVVSENAHIEVEYAAVDRVSRAPAAVRMLNTIANFQWWVKSNANARDGNEFLEGWMATNGVATDADGLATLTVPVDVDSLPVTFEVTLAEEQSDSADMGEVWTQSDTLTHTHTGLEHPLQLSGLPADPADLGAIYVTYETQRLVLGVYRETDDFNGFTNYVSPVVGGDHRPANSTGAEMTAELLVRGDRNRLETLEYDHDLDDETDMIEARGDFGDGGLLTFTHLPADERITVRFRMGSSDRVMVSPYADIETFGDDLDLGMSLGSFGAMSGGSPEVRLCSASAVDTSDDWCATYGYQWATGAISGTVGLHSGNNISVEPTTGQGASSMSDTTGAGGDYALTGLQDGTYEATAANNDGDYRLNGTPTRLDIEVYHDEFADEEDEDQADSAWAGRRAQITEDWGVTRVGLKIMGYVANDANRDNLIRGDEAVAGVTLRLLTDATFSTTTGALTGGKEVTTTETDAGGFYSFDALDGDGTEYWVHAVSTDEYYALRQLTGAWNVSGSHEAYDYPALPAARDVNKPYWIPESASSGNNTFDVPDAEGDNSGTLLVNFALVYRNGTITGSVMNMSGSGGNIDIRVYRCTEYDTATGACTRSTTANELTTTMTGGFELPGAMEAWYVAEIEDRGFGAPCVDADGDPDDDATQDHDDDAGTDPECVPAATTVLAQISGSRDAATFDPLHVYSTAASENDTLADGVRVAFRAVGTDDAGYNAADTADAGWTRVAGAATTANTTSLGTISWASESVTFVYPTNAIPTGASVRYMVGTSTTACAGNTCTLEANETPTTATAAVNTIEVTVTAANGYDDHVYSVLVARANPEDNELGTTRVRRHNADDTYADAGGTGTFADPYTLQTASSTATSLNLHVNLKNHGLLNDNARCAQTLIVRNSADEEVEASQDDEDDICGNERYTLTAAEGGSRYTLHVSSEDGVEKVHHLELTRGS